MRVCDLKKVVLMATNTILYVKGEKPCEIRCKAGNIPEAFVCYKVDNVRIKGLVDGYGEYVYYLSMDITDK